MNHIESLRVVLANTFVMYFKAHSYHWNVEGMNFSEFHNFFKGIYEELHGAIDSIAEEIRACDEYAPISLNELFMPKSIDEDTEKPSDAVSMLESLLEANEEVLVSLNDLFSTAEENDEQGLADFAAGRIDIHKKHGWMLRSFLKD